MNKGTMKTGAVLASAGIFAAALAAAPAAADSVRAVIDLSVDAGGGAVPLKVEQEVGFTPKAGTITVEVSGYKCTMGSSTQGSVPKGCNYSIDITGKEPAVVAREASGACMNVKPQCSR
ncbi:hypothetical protein [Jiella sonneratiae]|uniref:Uncharacterized protein n=1 Tax=Jiella sonneratiae TaxID=2816856 RepID=A0ABS3J9K5_9HYPH|nr:hypothetical protein [Jiella sonneratiae]MBO0906347.1 hypothetical protein [Jiella sonneratiae]